jgi:hypothetical protein
LYRSVGKRDGHPGAEGSNNIEEVKVPDVLNLAAEAQPDSDKNGPQRESPSRTHSVRQHPEGIGRDGIDKQMHGMHRPGEGSSPPKFRLEGFEKDPESVKKAVTRSGYKAGGYNNPAVEKRVFLWSIHLGWQKNAIKEVQRESR